jgi:hypothetical protein
VGWTVPAPDDLCQEFGSTATELVARAGIVRHELSDALADPIQLFLVVVHFVPWLRDRV